MATRNKKKTKSEKTSGGFLRGNAGWYLTLFFVSCWMFFIGLLVGRGTMPVKFKVNPIRREIEMLKQADEAKELDRVRKAAEAAKAPSDLAFYEELKKKPPQPQPVKKAPPEKAKAKKKEPPKPVKKTEKKASEKRVVKKKVADPSKTKSQQPSQQPSSGKPFTVQAASIKELAEAEKLVAKLKNKGFPAYKTIGIIPEKGIWFRVRVGRFSSKTQAAGTMKKLEKEGFEPLIIHTQE